MTPKHFRIILVLLCLAPVLWAGSNAVPLLERFPFSPYPQQIRHEGGMGAFPKQVAVDVAAEPGSEGVAVTETLLQLFRLLPEVSWSLGGEADYRVSFVRDSSVVGAEAYSLSSGPKGIVVRYSTEAGRFYGAQTLYQLFAYAWYGAGFLQYSQVPAEPDAVSKRYIPYVEIRDAPVYATRACMVDLGRATFSKPLLKRLIRIMGHLKLNTLHLHLYDDQLCGFRFERLPLGNENPYALDAADLRELVAYARERHVSVMPELESWGHVGSLLYHYPELYGAPGLYGGASFGIGEATYALLEKMYDEVVPCLEDDAAVHVGLDEANWTLLPGEESGGHTPENLVRRIHEILQRVASRHGKTVRMHLWADHGGRPIPKELQDKVVVEPWRYLGADAPSIVESLKKYGGVGRTPLMMGGGANSTAFSGGYEATRLWCQEGTKYPNVEGVTLCLWETNDIGGRLVTLYAGSNYAWSPATPRSPENDPLGERLRQQIDRQMRDWQLLFPDADPEALRLDRGPEVRTGRYVWPPLSGKPVAPTAILRVPDKN